MELTLRLPEKVRQDTLAYRGQVEKFTRGGFSPTAFRAYRVPMGIYEQRKADTDMVRIRIAAGTVSAVQLKRIARLSRDYGNGVLHVTTRQDIQIHDVDIDQTPNVLEGLLEVGLSSRGGGGNTVRNVTACPRAGLCPLEQFNVAPHALAVAEYLLQFDSSYNLPRKYKIAFSGCSEDCALASVADLGFFAHIRDGARGFAVYAGGGLGPHPAVGVKIEDFVAEREVFEVAEAIKRLFDKQGDRANRRRARLRYVLARLGAEEFARLYRLERADVAKAGLDGAVPNIEEVPAQLPDSAEAEPIGAEVPDVLPEKGEGRCTFKLALSLGDIPADDLVKVAQLAETYGSGSVRTTQQQDLLITSVPIASLASLRRELQELHTDMSADGVPGIVACTGASTCKLGLCLSRGLTSAIAEKLTGRTHSGEAPPTIRISGCPNSCAQHYIGDIGLQGQARRVDGKLMPCYDILTGARTREGQARLGQKMGALPAKSIPDFLAELSATGPVDAERAKRLIAKYSELTSRGAPDDYYHDWGSDQPFSLAGRGPGECGAGVMDVIRLDLDEAKRAMKECSAADTEHQRSRLLHQAVLASARALMVTLGLEPKTDREIFEAFRQNLIEPGWVAPATRKLLDEAIDWRMGDRETLADGAPEVEKLIERIEELFLSLDASLKFRVEPIAPVESPPETETRCHQVDLRGVACPLNFVKTKLAIEKIPVGEILEVALDDGEPIRNVPGSVTGQGQEVLETVKVEDHFLLRIRRLK